MSQTEESSGHKLIDYLKSNPKHHRLLVVEEEAEPKKAGWSLYFKKRAPKLFENKLVSWSYVSKSPERYVYLRNNPQCFEVFDPYVPQLFLHKFFTEDGAYDYAITPLPWEEYRHSRGDLSEVCIHITSNPVTSIGVH